MRKLAVSLFIVFLIMGLVAVAGCGGSSTSTAASVAGKTYTSSKTTIESISSMYDFKTDGTAVWTLMEASPKTVTYQYQVNGNNITLSSPANGSTTLTISDDGKTLTDAHGGTYTQM
jgi:nitrous oxidase accessory protein NosD